MLRTSVSGFALSWAIAASVVMAAPAAAQSNPSPADGNAAAAASLGGTAGDAIVVTGRADNKDQHKVDTSYAISTISDQDLRLRAPIGVAEALKQVPGFYTTPTSGEVAGGVRVCGGPSAIFYSNTPGAAINFITRRGGDHL